MCSCIQDEFSPHAVVLRTAVIKQRVGKVGHSFVAECVPTAEEHGILEKREKTTDGKTKKVADGYLIKKKKTIFPLAIEAITRSLRCMFSSKSRTPMMLFRQRARQPTNPTWQSKNGSPIISTYVNRKT